MVCAKDGFVMRSSALTAALLVGLSAGGCNRGEGAKTVPVAPDVPAGSTVPVGCDHDVKAQVDLKHVWPYSAGADEVRWGDRRETVGLQVKPHQASIRRDSARWNIGARIDVRDTLLRVQKPRRLTVKQDVAVTVLSRTGRSSAQTAEITQVAAGQVVDYLAYDANGTCFMRVGEVIVSATCTPTAVFEGLTDDDLSACVESWWLKVKKGRHKGWIQFDSSLMRLVKADEP